jgi:uncharacterized protein
MVRVSKHQNVGRIPREQFGGRRAANLVAVADVNGQPACLGDDLVGQHTVERIDVSGDGLHWRDAAQRIKDIAAADIAGVKDLRDAAERAKQAVANEAVRVGDEADYDGLLAMRICDAHCHFFSSRFLELLTAGHPGFSATDRTEAVLHRLGWDDPRFAENLADRWIAELDHRQVARAAIMASIPGDEASVAAAVRRHPSRFVGFFMFNPAAGEVTSRLERALDDRALRAICLFPAMHGYNVDDDRVKEVFSVAAANGAAVFVHCGVLTVGVRKKLGLPSPFDLRLGDPLAVAAVASRFPTVAVIIPHFGAGMLREALMAVEQCGNIHLDSSSSNNWMKYYPGLTLDQVFRQVLAVAGPDRILFGTDSSFFPRGWQQSIYDVQEAMLRTIGISLDDREKIVGGNFDRLFPVGE